MATLARASSLLKISLQGITRNNRKFCGTHFETKEFEEIKFNVPWGHIAGKWYGPKNIRPIVGLHGWQDNAGTFDRIAPLLPPHVGFLTIDLPGHGLSSWLPHGCTYHSLDYVTLILTLMREFNWDKISMICHSISSINAFVFCSLFPDKCDMNIGLDVLKPIVQLNHEVIDRLSERMETHFKANNMNITNDNMKMEPPSYDFHELVEKIHIGTEQSIDREYCQFMLKRGIKPSMYQPHKYYFSRDSRLRGLTLFDLSKDVLSEMARRITCPHLFIKALQGPYYEPKEIYDEIISSLKQKPTFECYEVDGTHHVHLNEPRKIADIINPFINKHRPE